jgi:type II secretory pathway pseudopilin PulG
MELTIVLAILAIIAAILIPSFLITSDRARLRGDIQSARVIQSAINLYSIERGVFPGSNIEAIIDRLQEMSYLPEGGLEPQTNDGRWTYSQEGGVQLDISRSPEGVKRAYESLPDSEKAFVTGG